MKDLDERVSDIVLGEAVGGDRLMNLHYAQVVDVTRWIFKMACCFDAMNRTRGISPNVVQSLMNMNYLPRGIVVFFSRVPGMPKTVGSTLLDFWTFGPGNVFLTRNAEREMRAKIFATSRVKFAVQYNKIIIGCVYFDSPGASFTFRREMHNLLFNHGAGGQWDASRVEIYMPAWIQRNQLNMVLATPALSAGTLS